MSYYRQMLAPVNNNSWDFFPGSSPIRSMCAGSCKLLFCHGFWESRACLSESLRFCDRNCSLRIVLTILDLVYSCEIAGGQDTALMKINRSGPPDGIRQSRDQRYSWSRLSSLSPPGIFFFWPVPRSAAFSGQCAKLRSLRTVDNCQCRGQAGSGDIFPLYIRS